MCEKRIKYNHEKGRRISLLYLLALSPQIPLPGPPIGLPLLRYLAHFPHLISKAKTAKIQESMKRGDTRLDILWSILDQNCALFNTVLHYLLFSEKWYLLQFLVQEWTFVGRTNTTTKRHGTVDHDDGTPQLSNCRKLEACMSTHHQKGSSNIKVIRNSSISDSECFLTREIKDLMTFQDSLYVCRSYYLFYYNWTIQQKLS